MRKVRGHPSARAVDPEQLFCSRPFKWFEISRKDEEGQVFACCPSWLDTPMGNLTRQSVQEVWNGPVAQDIRRSVLDGSFSYCNEQRCPHLHTVTEPVQRIKDVTDPMLLAAIHDGLTILPYGPRDINCSYDRSCNLSCPTCRHDIIMEHNRSEEILGIQKKINDEALAEAEFLYITGSGDPFGSPYFRKWLQTMKHSDMPRLEKIHLHSNGQLWTERTWNTISPEVRQLIRSADISIDAARPETYAINRRGGEMERLLNNLEFIGSLRANGPLNWFEINMVVQQNNYEQMAEFVELGKRFHCDTVYFHQIVNWGTFSDREFADRAIHLPGHQEHQAFVKTLENPALEDEIVFLGNLADLKRAA
jgi:organic radical activating enzyme